MEYIPVQVKRRQRPEVYIHLSRPIIALIPTSPLTNGKTTGEHNKIQQKPHRIGSPQQTGNVYMMRPSTNQSKNTGEKRKVYQSMRREVFVNHIRLGKYSRGYCGRNGKIFTTSEVLIDTC
jgi:hypothetical protein